MWFKADHMNVFTQHKYRGTWMSAYEDDITASYDLYVKDHHIKNPHTDILKVLEPYGFEPQPTTTRFARKPTQSWKMPLEKYNEQVNKLTADDAEVEDEANYEYIDGLHQDI